MIANKTVKTVKTVESVTLTMSFNQAKDLLALAGGLSTYGATKHQLECVGISMDEQQRLRERGGAIVFDVYNSLNEILKQ